MEQTKRKKDEGPQTFSHLSANKGGSDIERGSLDICVWGRHPVSVNPNQILDAFQKCILVKLLQQLTQIYQCLH